MDPDGKGDRTGAGPDPGAISGDQRQREPLAAPLPDTRRLHRSALPRGTEVGTAEPPRVTEVEPTEPPRITEVGGWDAIATHSPWPSSSDPGAWSGGGAATTRYRVDGVIGRGGMGEVLSAHDEQIGRSVAIKRLRSPDAPADIITRFMREAKIQGRLDHPAIPPVHELWRDERGQPFFVMKRLSGITLAEVLARLQRADADAQRRFTRQHLLRAFVDVCLAIEFAHTRGIVHRDLKPANVMLGEFGEVYVLDWGVARVLAEGASDAELAPATATEVGDTMAGVLLGTPGYMAPEQVRGDADLDGRADVYALGCILFELLAGEPLHEAGEAGLAEAQAGVDARPSRRAPDREIPPELDSVCVKATRLDRAARLPTARAVGDAVQRYLDGDRDVATRGKLAAGELTIAQAAIERGASIMDRRTAIRAAARALALDPSSREAAELVARLMIEPPPETPQEVDRELAAVDDQAMRTQARLGALAMVAYFVFLPLLFLAGFRETWFLIAGPAIAALTMASALSLARRPILPLVYTTFAGNALLVAAVARGVSPFLVAPGLAIVIGMLYAMHPRVRRVGLLWAALAAAVLLPWAAELGGLISQTTFITDRGIEIRVVPGQLDVPIATVTLALYTLVALGVATALSRAIARSRAAMQRSLHVQAWQLRQLVPRGGVGESFVTMPRASRLSSTSL